MFFKVLIFILNKQKQIIKSENDYDSDSSIESSRPSSSRKIKHIYQTMKMNSMVTIKTKIHIQYQVENVFHQTMRIKEDKGENKLTLKMRIKAIQ